VTNWFNFMRDVCLADMLRNPIHLGGPGHVVATDVSVVAKAKHGNGHARPVPAQWVFGGKGSSWALTLFMELVPQHDADAATLIPIIQRLTLPGSNVWSDEWATYNQLNALGYVQETVNHS